MDLLATGNLTGFMLRVEGKGAVEPIAWMMVEVERHEEAVWKHQAFPRYSGRLVQEMAVERLNNQFERRVSVLRFFGIVGTVEIAPSWTVMPKPDVFKKVIPFLRRTRTLKLLPDRLMTGHLKWLACLPSLKTLVVNGSRLLDFEAYPLTCIPNLEDLTLRNWRGRFADKWYNVWEDFRKLKVLTIEDSSHLDESDLLLIAACPLKKLNIKQHNSFVSIGFTSSLFEQMNSLPLGSTLESLTVRLETNELHAWTRIPRPPSHLFPNLQHFEGIQCTNADVCYENKKR